MDGWMGYSMNDTTRPVWPAFLAAVLFDYLLNLPTCSFLLVVCCVWLC